MPLLYKVFLFFFLQQGINAIDIKGSDNNKNNMETALLSNEMTLWLEGDQKVIGQMISICFLYDNNCDVSNESETKVKIVFKNLRYTTRNRIMERSRMIHNNLQIHWAENSLAKS